MASQRPALAVLLLAALCLAIFHQPALGDDI